MAEAIATLDDDTQRVAAAVSRAMRAAGAAAWGCVALLPASASGVSMPVDLVQGTASYPPLLVANPAAIADQTATPSANQALLARVRTRSGLTRQQLADAMNVQIRSVFSWQKHGRMKEAHQRRLAELDALVTSLIVPSELNARAEFFRLATDSSLLDELTAGASPLELVAKAPWRAIAERDLERAVHRAMHHDGPIVASDFVYLLHVPSDEFEEVVADTRARLRSADFSRSDWMKYVAAMEAAYPPRDWTPLVDDEDDIEEPVFRILTTPSPEAESAPLGPIGRPRGAK